MAFTKKLFVVLCLLLVSVCVIQTVLPESFSIVSTAEAAGKAKLNKTKVSLYIGETVQLKVNNYSGKITWKSSDKSIAKVNTKGKVQALKAGKATITAKINGQTLKCSITVKKALSSSSYKVSLEKGSQTKVIITYKNNNTIRWTSDNESIATGEWEEGWDNDNTGLIIHGNGVGSATITVQDKKTKEKIKIKVNVKGSTYLTGSVHELYGKTIAEANKMLADKLTYVGDGYYANSYFGVALNSSSKINWIAILSGTKYNLFWVEQGMGWIRAQATLGGFSDWGWRPINNSPNDNIFVNTKYPNRKVMFTEDSDGKVKNIVYGIID